MKILTDEQAESVILALARGQKSFTLKDAQKAVNFATETFIDAGISSLIESGKVNLSVKHGKVFVSVNKGGEE